MTQLPSEKPALFNGRHFNHLLFIQAVRWYVLSYRDVCDLMEERGVTIVHTTVLRWVQRFVPAFEKKRRLRQVISLELERVANECTVSGDSFNRPGCGAVRYRERSFPYIQLKRPLGSMPLRTRPAIFDDFFKTYCSVFR